MKKYIIALAALAAVAAGCKSEGTLTPTAVTNWLEITDPGANGDAVDKKIYEIYKNHGISVFLTDTLGSEDRGWKDENGNTKLYYEIIDLNYNLTAAAPGIDEAVTWTGLEWWKPEEKAGVLPLLELLDEKVIPFIGTENMPRIAVITEEIGVAIGTGAEYYATTLQGAGFIAFSCGDLDWDDPATPASFISTLVSDIFMGQYSDYGDMLTYWQIPVDLLQPILINNEIVWSTWLYHPEIDPKDYGLLDFNPFYAGYLPWQDEDFSMYLSAILSMTQAQFEAENAAYPAVIERYRILRKVFEDTGFDIDALK